MKNVLQGIRIFLNRCFAETLLFSHKKVTNAECSVVVQAMVTVHGSVNG